MEWKRKKMEKSKLAKYNYKKTLMNKLCVKSDNKNSSSDIDLIAAGQRSVLMNLNTSKRHINEHFIPIDISTIHALRIV